jgi:hypothetical protein
MIESYVSAVSQSLEGTLQQLMRLAWPLAVCLGLTLLAVALTLAFGRDTAWLRELNWRRYAANASGYTVMALFLVGGWAILRTIRPLAEEDLRWRESAEATANPVPDAPPITQVGPVVAALKEHTYTRTLTLPPMFLQRIGTDGVGTLAPYLSNPSTDDVLRLVDTFRRSGQDVVFTRQVTQLEEDPIPFTTSQVHVSFRRLTGRAYDADFEGHYVFQNQNSEPINARFLFTLPNDNTIRNLSVSVGGQAIAEQNQTGAYEWRSQLNPGERREAVIHYRAIGAQTWRYDLGSRRRRVEQFQLDTSAGGAARFLRGSLQPTGRASNGAMRWDLSNVVTAQEIGLSFPPNTEGRDAYLQALSALPASLALFLVGMFVVGWRFRLNLAPGSLVLSVVTFTFCLGASAILANYVGPIIAVILAPLVGVALVVRMSGRYALLAAAPTALLPALFLSPEHSGLLLLVLAGTTLVAAQQMIRSQFV